MVIYKHLYTIITIFICLYYESTASECSQTQYNRCVTLADPLLKDPALVFPATPNDIDLVCRTWAGFVDCLQAYTERCFTRQQRTQFSNAVQSPIQSVHMMCTHQPYQQEYLVHAPCIKSTVTSPSHCGAQYDQLVEQVSQGEAISRASLCCSHDRFRRCVVRETQRVCDSGRREGAAAKFAEQTIDKALSFLQDQCYNYIPNSGDCLTVSYKSDDQLALSTSPWAADSSIQHRAPLDPASPQATDVTILELGSGSDPDTPPMPDPTNSAHLGSRTRPSSYGRSSSWDISTPNPPITRPEWATQSTWLVQHTGNTHIASGSPGSPSSPGGISSLPGRGSSFPGGAASSPGMSSVVPGNVGSVGSIDGQSTGFTGNTGYSDGQQWSSNHLYPTTNVAQQSNTNTPPVSNPGYVGTSPSTETWYPVAGSHVGGSVDEPNQLGLAKPKNGAPRVLAVQLSFTVVATVLVALC